MIPQNIYQFFPVKLPPYIEENIQTHFDQFDMIHLKLQNMNDFVKSHLLDGMTFEGFEMFSSSDLKKTFFILLFMYIHGGIYLDVGCRIENIHSILSHECVLLTTPEQTILPVFILTTPKHPSILNYLLQMYQSKGYPTIIEDERVFYLNYIQHNSYIYHIKDSESLHYITRFSTSVQEPFVPIEQKRIKPPSLTRIIITYQLKYGGDMFSNGFGQNVLFLYELFYNMGYDVYFLVSEKDLEKFGKERIYGWNSAYKLITFNDIFVMDCDIFMVYGTTIDPFFLRVLKQMKTILVRYISGNSYMNFSEIILYGCHSERKQGVLPQNESLYLKKNIYDQIWIIPQNMKMNGPLFNVLTRAPTLEVPFVWSNSIINHLMKQPLSSTQPIHLGYRYRGIQKRIGIYEPNLSVLKWALIPYYICENTYRTLPERIKDVFITNIIKKENSKLDVEYFKQFINTSDLFLDKKVQLLGRFQLLESLIIHNIDVIVSHQWGNPLNYIYIELAWLGWPIIHNAELCKDIRYYYNGYDIQEATDVLTHVLLNHDKNIDMYVKRNRNYIQKYLTTNPNLHNDYFKLIEELYPISLH